MILNPDFREFVELLNKHDVRFLVVGGYAVAFHGHPRYTKDLDLWIEPEATNAERLVDVLREFGFGSVGLEAGDFLKPGQIVQLGRPPARIDLITRLKGIEFEGTYDARVVVDVEGVDVPFIDLESLKRNKRAVDRSQDRADLERLE
ncbi:MAG TPA: nucleotidyltransferase [Rhodothermales bacterium]|nr:nucleotidyltransferase [Rhodothermales bacterium]